MTQAKTETQWSNEDVPLASVITPTYGLKRSMSFDEAKKTMERAGFVLNYSRWFRNKKTYYMDYYQQGEVFGVKMTGTIIENQLLGRSLMTEFVVNVDDNKAADVFEKHDIIREKMVEKLGNPIDINNPIDYGISSQKAEAWETEEAVYILTDDEAIAFSLSTHIGLSTIEEVKEVEKLVLAD